MAVFAFWDEIKQVAGFVAPAAPALLDPKTGGFFPLNVVKEQLRHPLQVLGVAGKQENVIPAAAPSQSDPPRDVLLGSHPVGGMIAQLMGAVVMANAPMGAVSISPNPAPDPTHHWAVLVGDYYHELGGDVDLRILYNNDKRSNQTFMGAWKQPMIMGKTTFNDEAIRQAAEEVIAAMDPAYNVYNNNCQLFCMNLADKICQGGHGTPVTSWQMIPALHSEPAKRAHEIMVEHTPAVQI